MKYTEAEYGRVFVARLQQGEVINSSIEKICREENILRASVIILGGAEEGSRFVAGPKEGNGGSPVPIIEALNGIHETAGVGTVFPLENGEPSLHLHCAFGRKQKAAAGCARAGVRVWTVMEAVIFEIKGSRSYRKKDPRTGFELLEP